MTVRLFVCGLEAGCFPVRTTSLPSSSSCSRAALHDVLLCSDASGLWRGETLVRPDLSRAQLSRGGVRHFFVWRKREQQQEQQQQVCEGFGANEWGQAAAPRESVEDMACGWESSAAACGQDVLLWGRTDDVLPREELSSRAQVKPLQGIGRVVKVALGFGHLMALTDAGEAFAVGNINRQKMTVRKLGENIVDITSGMSHGVLLSSEGKVFCFGSAGDGKLGALGIGDTFDPVHVELPSKISKIAAGCDHTVVIDEKGKGFSMKQFFIFCLFF